MRSLRALVGRHEIDVLLAENASERRQGMRALARPEPLLLAAAPLIHTLGCSEIDLLWIRRGRVCQIQEARPRRLYAYPAWWCLELPSGTARALGIRKKDTFRVLG